MTVEEIDKIILEHINRKEEDEFRIFHAKRRMDMIRDQDNNNIVIAGTAKNINKMLKDFTLIERHEKRRDN